MHGLVVFSMIATVTIWLSAPAGRKVPACFPLVRIVLSLSGKAVCSTQSRLTLVQLAASTPSSSRNLIGNVRPSASGMSTPVLAFLMFPKASTSTSAKPKRRSCTTTRSRKLEPTSSVDGSVFQFTMYCSFAASTRTVCDPGPLVFVKATCSWSAGHGITTLALQTCTTGESRGLNTPVGLGAATSGGSHQKCGLLAKLELVCPASERSEEHTSELQSLAYLVCRIIRSEEHTSELQSLAYLVCRLLLEKKK